MEHVTANMPGTEMLEQKPQECAKHGAFIAKRLRFGKDAMQLSSCPECSREAYQADKLAAEVRNQAERRDARIASALRGCGIPARFKNASFENYRTEQAGQQRAHRICHAYARNFDEARKTGQCLILAGTMGTGKTHLACSIMAHLIPLGHTALYTGVLDAIKRIRATWAPDAKETEHAVMAELRNVDLLVLDEIGVQFGTEAEATQTFEIINNRYMDMKPTLILTNVFASDLGRVIGERTLDRLRENGGALVPFDWDSSRGK